MRTRLSLLALTLTMATACFSSDGDGDGDDTDRQTGGSAGQPATGGAAGEGGGGKPGTDDPATGGVGAGGAGTGGSADPSTGGNGSDETDDPYCPHAWNGFEQLDIFLAETNALTDDPDMDRDTLNAHGAAALEAAELTGEHFGRAKDFVVETETSEAFDALLLYQELYMVPLAQLAATASDSDAYSMGALQLLLMDGVAGATAAGALASGTVSTYTVQRCGHARWP